MINNIVNLIKGFICNQHSSWTLSEFDIEGCHNWVTTVLKNRGVDIEIPGMMKL